MITSIVGSYPLYGVYDVALIAGLGFCSGCVTTGVVWLGCELLRARRQRPPVREDALYVKTPQGVRTEAVVAYYANSGRGVQTKIEDEGP